MQSFPAVARSLYRLLKLICSLNESNQRLNELSRIPAKAMLFAVMKFAGGILLILLSHAVLAFDFPPPLRLGPVNEYGSALQRSMRLMAESPVERKRTVKVLLYGQSITQEVWTVWLSEFLRQQYPNANLVITNLAVGYTSEILFRPAGIDIPNFYPDLMIFHDYGSEFFFEEMVRLTRRQTTADILIQNDHVHLSEDLDEPTDPAFLVHFRNRAWRNYVALPDIAQRYGAELADIRTLWKYYIDDYDLNVEDLLRDHVHPNLQGSFLMTELLKSYLHVSSSIHTPEDRSEITYRVGRDIDWNDDRLELSFTGNRVDIVVEAQSQAPIEVRIDRRRPSEFPELYRFTRPDWYPDAAWLSILKVTSEKPLLEEDWIAKVIHSTVTNGVPFVRFEVTGSRTGFDGEGVITARFVSNSGRVVIEPADWLMLYLAATNPQLKPLPVGHEIGWRSYFAGKDNFIPTIGEPSFENAITVAQGLANGAHTLTLKRSAPAAISAIRIYNPLARQQPELGIPQIMGTRMAPEKLWIQVGHAGRFVIEQSPNFTDWNAVTAPMQAFEIGVPYEPDRRFFRVRSVD